MKLLAGALLLLGTLSCGGPPRLAHIPWRLVPIDVAAPVPVYVATPSATSAFQARDMQLVEQALSDWSAASDARIRFTSSTEAAARIRIYWRPAVGQHAGEMQTSARSGQRVNDVLLGSMWAGLPPALVAEAAQDPTLRTAIVYRMALHEIGHALGLVHTEGLDDAMYHGADPDAYFRRYARRLQAEGGNGLTGVSGRDRERVARLYPEERITGAARPPDP